MNVGLIQVTSRKSPTNCKGGNVLVKTSCSKKATTDADVHGGSTLSRRRAVVLGCGHSTPFCAHRLSKNLRVSEECKRNMKGNLLLE